MLRRHRSLIPPLFFVLAMTAHAGKQGVIYGADDRHDVYQENSVALRDIAASTVALVPRSRVQTNTDNTITLRTSQFGPDYGTCTDEPYYTQPTAAFCSGFLVSEDRIVTAGHCIATPAECNDTVLVFGFSMIDANSAHTTIPSDHVYKCSAILARQQSNGPPNLDYAVIQLDRKVTDRAPLAVRRTGHIAAQDPLTVIGHPSGLPLKISGGGNVRDVSHAGYFVANLDTYGGNSGSAVINTSTREVEGILVRGEADFQWDRTRGCLTSNRCSDDGCRGEDSTDITFILNWIP